MPNPVKRFESLSVNLKFTYSCVYSYATDGDFRLIHTVEAFGVCHKYMHLPWPCPWLRCTQPLIEREITRRSFDALQLMCIELYIFREPQRWAFVTHYVSRRLMHFIYLQKKEILHKCDKIRKKYNNCTLNNVMESCFICMKKVSIKRPLTIECDTSL